jgi:general stress protein YciG
LIAVKIDAILAVIGFCFFATKLRAITMTPPERGFVNMSEEERREIARKGESVSDEKRSFAQDHELASEAGRKGGNPAARTVSQRAAGRMWADHIRSACLKAQDRC